MYTLYYHPNACSLATHTVLNMINQPVNIVFRDAEENFLAINPANVVPVLNDGDTYLKEGAAILLYLLDKHNNNLLPKSGPARQQAIENMMFANATMHPAYGRLFFAAKHFQDEAVRNEFLNWSANAINQLWDVAETLFTDGPYLGGASPSPADVLLAVYSRWGQFFPVDIIIGERTQNMIDLILENDAFKRALSAEQEDQKRYA